MICIALTVSRVSNSTPFDIWCQDTKRHHSTLVCFFKFWQKMMILILWEFFSGIFPEIFSNFFLNFFLELYPGKNASIKMEKKLGYNIYQCQMVSSGVVSNGVEWCGVKWCRVSVMTLESLSIL